MEVFFHLTNKILLVVRGARKDEVPYLTSVVSWSQKTWDWSLANSYRFKKLTVVVRKKGTSKKNMGKAKTDGKSFYTAFVNRTYKNGESHNHDLYSIFVHELRHLYQYSIKDDVFNINMLKRARKAQEQYNKESKMYSKESIEYLLDSGELDSYIQEYKYCIDFNVDYSKLHWNLAYKHLNIDLDNI